VYQICVSGAAKGTSVDESKELARAIGKAIAESGHALMTGATIGLPNFAAEAYKAAGGKMSFGISPAGSKVEHVRKYRLPTEAYDVILYSGLHYVGRDALLITSSDGVISLGGRLGTLHEFTIAMESDTPIGFLQGSGGISDQIEKIMELSQPIRPGAKVLFDTDAQGLLDQLVAVLDHENSKYKDIFGR
jgi:uncharacterized protein (TIGR00725 family)